MSVVDLHPEELLDKDERGELTDDERARLDAHLDRCTACRAEVLLRADFAAELHDLDSTERPSALLDLVQGALAAPPAATPAPSPSPPPPPAPEAPEVLAPTGADPGIDAIPGLRRRPRRTATVLLVAAALMAASAAGATGLTGRIWLGLRGNPQEVTHASGATSKAAPVVTSAGASGIARAAATTPAPLAEAAETAETVDTAPVPEAIAPAATAAVRPPPSIATTAMVTITAAPPVVVTSARVGVPAVAPSPAPAPAPSTASALFDSANAARRDGDTASALARYDALDKQFPQTAEARVAKATTGKLLLDRGDAAGALARFDAYLASGASELREEAMAGRATALERLGRDDDEARAWAALLAEYPSTPYAVHAKTRVLLSTRRSLGR